MALRFRRSVKLAPGIRMNFSGSGVSWTLGPRGASVGIGRRGTYLNSGMPGTGLYAREQLGSSAPRASSSPGKTTISITVSIDDDGNITFRDEKGNPLLSSVIDAAKKQQGDAIRALISEKCHEINGQIEALGEIHRYTPDCRTLMSYQTHKFPESPPAPPTPKRPGFFASLFKSKVAKIEADNAKASANYERARTAWQNKKAEFDATELANKQLIESAVSGNPAAIESVLEMSLQEIVWPRETDVSFEVLDGGSRIALDVDLPEIEDFPTKTASAPSRGYKLTVQAMSATQVQKLYMQHVHAVGFRIIGEAFALSPTIREVLLSAYSQRPDKTTGHVRDEYLYSVRVRRNDWQIIRFDNLDSLDVVEALARFEIQRTMSKTGVFKPVEPLPV